MASNQNEIHFYYPPGADPDCIPEAQGKYMVRQPGNYVWVVRTYAYLRSNGFGCNSASGLSAE